MVCDSKEDKQVFSARYRSQNNLKNRFYGTLRNFIRFVLHYFDPKKTCYNLQISKLSPKTLIDLYYSKEGKIVTKHRF